MVCFQVFLFFILEEDHFLDHFLDPFFSINRHCLQSRLPSFLVAQSKVVGTTLLPSIPLSYLRGWNGNFGWDFSIKIWRIHLMRACHLVPILLSLKQDIKLTRRIKFDKSFWFYKKLKFTFKSWLVVFIFVWLDRAGCKESGVVNIVAYF